MSKEEQRQFDRERLLLRYTVALERGDLDSVAAILQAAQQDAVLEQMILEINDVEAAEIEEAGYAQDAAVVRELLQTHLLSASTPSAAAPPPLTVGNVIARIHADAAALRVRVEGDALAATQKYQAAETPLPSDLSVRGVSRLLEEVGIKAGRRFQELFRETALFLRMGRNQGMARLAATRRQQQSYNRASQFFALQAPNSNLPNSKSPDSKSPEGEPPDNQPEDGETS